MHMKRVGSSVPDSRCHCPFSISCMSWVTLEGDFVDVKILATLSKLERDCPMPSSKVVFQAGLYKLAKEI